MHIAVDADDVVVDFIGGLLAAVKKEHGVTILQESITEWDLHPVLDHHLGQSFWTWLRVKEWLWANFPAVDGAIGAIDKLRRDGHYLEMITSKPDWAEHNVWKFLGKWRPAFHRVTITKLEDKKADFTNADILIDDKPQNVLDFAATGREAILFSAPHNRGFTDLPKGIVRADNWQDVLGIIGALSIAPTKARRIRKEPPYGW